MNYSQNANEIIRLCQTIIERINQHLRHFPHHEKYALSRYTIAPVSRGLNFVGFRTWRKTRFVRRHSMHNFSRSLKRNDIPSIVSIMGNARHSASYNHFCRRIKTERPDLIHQLPERHRYACTNLPLHQSR